MAAHGLDDPAVAGAAAQVAAEQVTDGFVIGMIGGVRGAHRGQQAGRAVAALQRVRIAEALLQRGQATLRGEPFDGGDLMPVGTDREGDAGSRRLPVEQDGAGTTNAVFTADMRAAEPQVVPQEVGEQPPYRHRGLHRTPVDGGLDGQLRHGLGRAQVCAHAAIVRKARPTSVPMAAWR